MNVDGKPLRPLRATAAHDAVKVIDQRLLPHRLHIEVTETIQALVDDAHGIGPRLRTCREVLVVDVQVRLDQPHRLRQQVERALADGSGGCRAPGIFTGGAGVARTSALHQRF